MRLKYQLFVLRIKPVVLVEINKQMKEPTGNPLANTKLVCTKWHDELMTER